MKRRDLQCRRQWERKRFPPARTWLETWVRVREKYWHLVAENIELNNSLLRALTERNQ